MREKILKKEKEAHKTFYRANTYKKIQKLAKQHGFYNAQAIRAGNPEYFAFCKPLVWPAILFEKLIDNKPLSFLKMYLIVCLTKR